jgi:hypothetical protein
VSWLGQSRIEALTSVNEGEGRKEGKEGGMLFYYTKESKGKSLVNVGK